MKSFVCSGMVVSAFLAACDGAPAPAARDPSSLTYITLEEHFDSPASLDGQEANPVFAILAKTMGDAYAKYMTDIEQYRLPSMNNNSIRVQIVSNDPTPQALHQPKVVEKINDQLAAAIAPHPDRFRGFCYLPMAYPRAAADELKRCVNDLGLVGALVDNHLNNMTFYDNTEYDVFWEAAQRLDVPIYLHPTYPPSQDVTKPGGRETPAHEDYSEFTAAMLAAHGYGWHADNGLNFLRLWLGGVFDRFPHVKLVLGHMGETIPYMLDRATDTLGSVKTDGVAVREAWARNVWVTTSGFFSLDPFATLQRTTAIDRILFSVDYPWSTNEDGVAFMEQLKDSGMIDQFEWEKIAFRNAEELLRL